MTLADVFTVKFAEVFAERVREGVRKAIKEAAMGAGQERVPFAVLVQEFEEAVLDYRSGMGTRASFDNAKKRLLAHVVERGVGYEDVVVAPLVVRERRDGQGNRGVILLESPGGMDWAKVEVEGPNIENFDRLATYSAILRKDTPAESKASLTLGMAQPVDFPKEDIAARIPDLVVTGQASVVSQCLSVYGRKSVVLVIEEADVVGVLTPGKSYAVTVKEKQ